MTIKKASELIEGDWFIDPQRAGRRPAKVLTAHGLRQFKAPNMLELPERIHFTLDDDTQWGPWVASYRPDDELITITSPTDMMFVGNKVVSIICDMLWDAGYRTREEAAKALPELESRLGALSPRERDATLNRFPLTGLPPASAELV